MSKIIKIKNRTNWLIAFIMGLALIVCLFIILIIVPLISAEESYFLSIFSYITKVIPFAGFFTLLLYFWLWNTFGKTILSIETDFITVKYKNKLFTRPKTFLKQEIKDIQTKDLTIEEYKNGTRYHFSWTGSTYSVVLVNKDGEKRIVDWITREKADEIIDKIKKVWY
ncbi:Uncharacterised protein [Chryseobacterium nakagawai]|uniref:Uncharacterized protein n=1 Tax=Chryseobacterium nakagawai TaxID=1241982 RepID=A0AAD1DRM3_CHRNA|nr:hypothetical protein [Chryseobacterium nakagawai]AZA91039.1 hypothetical protein EG343_10535 [Chryseobacterium nakagawai]VEH22592.1 Uncharacterised protein [Chryseobacterium nakagawai]